MTDASGRVRRAVSEALGLGDAEWSPVRSRSWSWQFSVIADSERLLVKVPRWEEAPTLEAALDAGPQEDTKAEFDSLAAIAEAVAGEPGLTAVTPVAYVAEVNAIVMEQLPGASLRNRLGLGSGSESALRWFESLGRWLASFHDLGGRHNKVFDADAETARWAALPSDGSFLGEARHVMVEAAEGLDGVEVGVGITHGDLTLSNVLVTPQGQVAVIDPNRSGGRLARDPAWLLSEARLGRGQLLTRGWLRDGAVIDAWGDAVLRGHGGLAPAVVSYERGAAAVERWQGLIGRLGPARAVLALGRSLFRSEIEAALRET